MLFSVAVSPFHICVAYWSCVVLRTREMSKVTLAPLISFFLYSFLREIGNKEPHKYNQLDMSWSGLLCFLSTQPPFSLLLIHLTILLFFLTPCYCIFLYTFHLLFQQWSINGVFFTFFLSFSNHQKSNSFYLIPPFPLFLCFFFFFIDYFFTLFCPFIPQTNFILNKNNGL